MFNQAGTMSPLQTPKHTPHPQIPSHRKMPSPVALLKPTRQTQPSVGSRPTSLRPLELWHLLSLDAPTVATVWTAFIAHAARIALPATSLAAMFLTVWGLYAADRLLDAQPLHQQPTTTADLELRHLFHHRHRRAFLISLAVATTLLAHLIPHLPAAALHLFLILGTALAGYFVLIHATSGAHRLPKELAVGLFFSAAVFIPTIARLPHPQQVPFALAAALFAALCCLNCLCIYAWEHPHPSLIATPHPLTEIASRHRRLAATLLLLVALVSTSAAPHPSLAASVALSALALLLVDRYRYRLAPVTLRAAADLVLLSPLLISPWLARR